MDANTLQLIASTISFFVIMLPIAIVIGVLLLHFSRLTFAHQLRLAVAQTLLQIGQTGLPQQLRFATFDFQRLFLHVF